MSRETFWKNVISYKFFSSFLIALITFICVFFLPNDVSSLNIIGYALIICSCLIFIRYRRNSNIALLIGIIIAINICLALSVCLNPYNTAFGWQIKLVDSLANITNAKNYLLFVNVLCLSIGDIKLKKTAINLRYNRIVFLLLLAVLVFILIFGFDRGEIGVYKSNANVLYEYALVIFVFAWKYGKNKKMRIVLLCYALLYILQGLVFGDRSSAFPMILMLIMLLYKKDVKLYVVLLLGLGGIFMANVIDIFRNSGGVFSFEIIVEALKRGLFVNTISYAFYGGTQVINYAFSSSGHFIHLVEYAAAILIGNTGHLSLTVLARSNHFMNKGGGMSHVYYYYWGGFAVTVIFAIAMGRIIHSIFNSDSDIGSIFRIMVTIFLIRWMLYYPSAFFRTAIFIPTIAYACLSIIDGRTYKK